MSWVPIIDGRRPLIGAVVHAAAGRCVPGAGSALDLLGPAVVGAVLWAVDRGLPDEVVARVRTGQAEAVLSWHSGPDAEVLVATGVAAREWLVLTGTLREVEVRPAPFSALAGEVWVSDGAHTERVPFPRADPVRLVDEHDVDAVLVAIRSSAGNGGSPQVPA